METAIFSQRPICLDRHDVWKPGETFVLLGCVVRVASGYVVAESVGVGFDSPIVFRFGEARVDEWQAKGKDCPGGEFREVHYCG